MSQDARAVSTVLGIVLLFAIVVGGTAVVLTVGATALDDTNQQLDTSRAEKVLTQFDSKTAMVALGGTSYQGVDLPAGGGEYAVAEDAGWMNLTVENAAGGGTSKIMNVTLGAVVYETGDTTLAYQGGGVWKRTESGAVMVSPPEFHYRNATLTHPLVSVTGDPGLSGTARIAKNGSTATRFPDPDAGDPALTNPLRNGKVKVTVSSEYYEAWGRYFSQRTTGSVDYDHDAGTATATLLVPSDVTVDNAFTTTGNGGIGGGVGVYSYDSRTDKNEGGVGIGSYRERANGDVYTTDGSDLRGGAEVNGDLYVGESLDAHGGVDANGNVEIAGDFESSGGPTIGGDLTVQDDFESSGDLDIGGDLRVGGDFESTGSLSVGGDIVVNGSVVLEDNVDSTVIAAGDVSIENGFDGDIVSGGSVYVNNGGITICDACEIRAEGDLVDSGSGNSYDGDIHVGGDIDAMGSGTVLGSSGSMTAGGTVDVANDNGGTIIEGAAAPSAVIVPSVTVERDTTLPDPKGHVDQAVSKYADENDNDTAAFDDFDGGNGVDDELTAGAYYYDGDLYYGGGPSLTFDTTGGDIHLVVDGDLDWNSIDVDIEGSNRVHVYVTEDVDISGGSSVETVDGENEGRGDQFWLYAGSTVHDTDVQASNGFYGVVYSESTVDLGGGTNVYGAVVTGDGTTTGGQDIYFDERLLKSNVFSKSSVPTISYLHVSVNRVNVTSR
ncbi:hypothetical protein C475_16791 [Halosimplex carlsbadense 2-9-1]|uniref:DUF7305 domain-containing protein n=1 Tax=Halosimplex carlsbadense 2-9-1 TaxID=797114 RepID=M0CJF8_9EURY|nr:hypothetical protein [Halosimplex carlsbadense]ELZ22778.1 hypothetical protein C475_16791 [Halosimplex carlsbadense 2-9-1]